MKPAKQTIESIQLLRAIACILVICSHFTSNYEEILKRKFLGGFLVFGWSGLDIFFVLSGFIIAYTSVKDLSKPALVKGFIKKRFVRIFPIYWFVITALLVLQLCLPFFYKTHFDFTFKNIISTYLLLPGHIRVNGVSWSLTYEIFFYMLFMIAFFIPQKKISLYIMLLYLLFLLIYSIMGMSTDNENDSLQLLLVNPMNIEFFLGVISALIYKKIKESLVFYVFAFGILLFIAGIIMTLLQIQLYTTLFNRVLLFGVPTFFIITGITRLELMGKIKVQHNFFVELGDASYSIYLFHLPVLAAFYKLILYAKITNDLVIHILIGVLMVCIYFLGVTMYHRIEKPMMRSISRFIDRK